MVDFIRMGLLELWRSRVEYELQNVEFLPTVGFETGTFRFQIDALQLRYEDWCLIARFNQSVLFLNLQQVVDVAK